MIGAVVKSKEFCSITELNEWLEKQSNLSKSQIISITRKPFHASIINGAVSHNVEILYWGNE